MGHFAESASTYARRWLEQACHMRTCIGAWKLLKIDSFLAPDKDTHDDMSGCQNYGPFLGPYYNNAPNI